MTRAARAIAFLGVGSLALSLGVTPALAQQATDPGPETLPVSGTIILMPDEPLTTSADAAIGGGGTWLATDHGPVIPLDARTLTAITDEPLITGATLEGVVTLPASTQAAVAELANGDRSAGTSRAATVAASAASGSAEPTEAEVLEVVANSVAEGAGSLPVAEAEVTMPTAAASLAGARHQADVVFFKTSGQSVYPSSTEISALMSRVSSYWKGQSNGLVDGISAGTPKVLTLPAADICNPNAAWSKAANWFNRSFTHYAGATSTRHLVALVLNGSCGAGMGSVGSKLGGGLVWANLDDYTRARGAVVGAQTVAHEFGHNFGLDHANARACSSSVADSRTSSSGYATSPCTDVEYGDLWNVMGVGIRGYTSTPAALTTSQREFLGAVPEASVQTIRPSDGASHAITINPLSATSGLRGIRVEPEVGDPFYIEYRNGTGQDAGMPQASGTSVVVTRSGKRLRVSNGVRVVKAMDRQNGNAASVLSRYASGYHSQAMTTRQHVTPYGSSAKVTVVSAGGSTAQVRIDFADPFLPASAPTISGSAQIGATLTARASAWTPRPEAVSYQWLRDGQAISGATASTFRLTSADLGSRMSVRVRGTRVGAAETATTRQTSAVLRKMSTARPSISGTAKAGRTLRLSRGTWKPSGVRFSYQWLRNGKPIGGATATTYRLKSKDRGARVSVKVTGKRSGYASAYRVSSGKRISRS